MKSDSDSARSFFEGGASSIPPQNLLRRVLATHVGDNSSIFQIILWPFAGFLAATVLLFTLSLPQKYDYPLALGLIATPLFFIFRNKEKLLTGAFVLSLPISMGFMLMDREESTNSVVKLTVKLYLCDFFLILLVITWLFKVVISKYDSKHSIWRNKLSIPLSLWIGMGIISYFPAIDKTAAVVGIIRMIRIFLTFFVIFLYARERKDIHFILNCLLLGLLLQSLIMFAQYATNSLFISLPGGPEKLDLVGELQRPNGTMGHSSNFAKFSGLILPIALAYVFFTQKLRNRFYMFTIWVCGSIALILTISRAGILTWLFSVIIFFVGIIILRIVPLRRSLPFLMIFILLVIFSAGILFTIGGERFESRIKGDEGSYAVRIPMWKVAINVIKAHPITGVGLNNYTLVHQRYDHTYEHISLTFPAPVHNLFLLYAAETGIPSLIFFLWFISEMVKGALRCISLFDTSLDKAIYFCIIIGVISIFLQSITGMGVANHLIHLSVVAILAACIAKQYSALTDHQRNASPV